jgi:Tocopherol cyclase
MEGYYWRLTDAAAGRVVVALCGVSSGPDGAWAAVALASHPGGFVRSRVEPVATADAERFGARAGRAFVARDDRLQVDLGPDARLDVRFARPRRWPRRAFGGLGPAHALPGIGQYWHPWMLGAAVEGGGRIGEAEVDLAGATAYAEKNWGAGFPRRWWWGQAHGFEHPELCLCFAGGLIGPPPLGLSASALVVGTGTTVLRLGPPLASVSAEAGDGGWRLRGRGPLHSLEVEGAAAGSRAVALPVPVPAERCTEPRAAQHLAGAVALTVRRGRRVLFRGRSTLAGLELGS